MPHSFYNAPASGRDHFVEPPSMLARVIAGLPSGLAVQMQRLWDRHGYAAFAPSPSRLSRSLRQAHRNWSLRRLLSLPHLFAALWILLLLWGERWVFESSIAACEWNRWERWVRFLGHCYLKMLTLAIAQRHNTPPFGLPGRSPAHRPAHLSWPTVAPLNLHYFTHRQFPQAFLYSASTTPAPRYIVLPR